MLEEELVKFIKKIRKRKAESQNTEVKAAGQGCPRWKNIYSRSLIKVY